MTTRTQEYGLGEFTYPRGWFMVCESSEVTERPIPLHFFGREFVAYRGRDSGKAIVLDAYCPHMGTHLGKNTTSYAVLDGQVEGDSIRCPYHAWRFGSDGRCNHIPYYDGAIPKAAALKSWTVHESLGIVWMWHDPEDGAPEWPAPRLDEYEDPSWVRWNLDHLGTIPCHPQEVLDNMTDVAHFDPVHGSRVEYFQNEFSAHIVRQLQGGGHRTLVNSTAILETDTIYEGPGILLSWMTGYADSVIFIANTPVEDGVIQVWHGLLVKSAGATPTEADIAAARQYQEASRLAFVQDFDIWANKRPAIQILQLPADGPFHKLRQWHKQFYNPRARRAEFHKQVDGVYSIRGKAPVRAPKR